MSSVLGLKVRPSRATCAVWRGSSLSTGFFNAAATNNRISPARANRHPAKSNWLAISSFAMCSRA